MQAYSVDPSYNEPVGLLKPFRVIPAIKNDFLFFLRILLFYKNFALIKINLKWFANYHYNLFCHCDIYLETVKVTAWQFILHKYSVAFLLF